MIVQLSDLAEFEMEVPAGSVVRLAATTQTLPGQGLAYHRLMLDLTARNDHDEIVWLHYSRQLPLIPNLPGRDEPVYCNDKDDAFAAAFPSLLDVVKGYLEAHGYEVRGGRYALPGELQALNGQFECATWEQQQGAFVTVLPVTVTAN